VDVDKGGGIKMETQFNDLTDRLSILLLKLIHSKEPTPPPSLIKEILRYFTEFAVNATPNDTEVFFKLLHVNAQIWRLESAIRQGKDDKMKLSEIGRRALLIRDWNRSRIELKNNLAGFTETKVDHASENKMGRKK
jgi:hypothetical protein